MALTFNPENHEYRLDGVVIPSVTQILKSAGLSNFDGVSQELLERNARFGTAVHKAIELKCQGNLDESTVDEALIPYINAFELFMDTYGFKPERHEVCDYHPNYRFGYTIDAIGTTADGKKAVVDIKTGQPKPADEIQVFGGYSLGEKADKYIIVYLSPDDFKTNVCGKATGKSQNIFLSALTIHNYRKEKGLL